MSDTNKIPAQMSAQEHLEWLRKDAKQVEKTKKYYKYQSEYYRMMYERTIHIEALEKALSGSSAKK